MSYDARRKKLRGGPKSRPKRISWHKRLRLFRSGPIDILEIMKEVWPQSSIRALMFNEPIEVVMERPWWAKMARARHWMTLAEYFAVPVERHVRKRTVVPSYLDNPALRAMTP